MSGRGTFTNPNPLTLNEKLKLKETGENIRKKDLVNNGDLAVKHVRLPRSLGDSAKGTIRQSQDDSQRVPSMQDDSVPKAIISQDPNLNPNLNPNPNPILILNSIPQHDNVPNFTRSYP